MIGLGEAQLDVVPGGAGPDRGGLVRRQVVEDDVDRVVVGSGRPDALERGEGVLAALVQPGDTPQPVLGEVVAAVEVADPVGAVVGGGQPVGMVVGRPAGAVAGPDAHGPNWSNAKHRSSQFDMTSSIRSSLASYSGSVEVFQV